ncbi:MAG TPA: hypothetical protein VHB77_13855 [Planctomycetaceae bacterium]|nr:hypothetical protein [Planctomycetaceae bacterium]
MIRLSGWLTIAVLWCGLLLADEPAPAVVGKRGDPAHFRFEGLQTFKAETIVRELRYDPLFLVASSRDAQLDALLATVSNQIRNGYRNEGFADAEVTTALTADGSALTVAVAEGPRTLLADLKIEAGDGFPIEVLRDWMTTRQPPEGGFSRTINSPAGPQLQWFDKEGKPKSLDSPLWTLGKPAPFAEATWARLETRIEKGLQSLGWSYAKPRVEVRRHADDPTQADLIVKIANPGPRDTLHSVEIRGAQIHTPASIETYLGLSQGMILDSRTLTDVRRRLLNSARFRKVDVTTASAGKRGIRKLVVTIEEYEAVPLLGDPLSPEEEVMLKFADWIQTAAAVGQEFDFSIQYDLLKLECVLAPQLGMWVRLQAPGNGENRVFSSEFYADDNGTGLALPLSRIKYMGSSLGPRAFGSTRLAASARRERGKEGFALLFGFGLASQNDAESSAPFRWLITVEPAAAIGVLHQSDVQVRLNEETLDVTGARFRMKVSVHDGSLQEFESVGDELQFSGRFRPGSLAERKADFDRRTADFEDWHDAKRPMASGCRFLLKSVEQLAAARPMTRFAVHVAERMCQDPAFDGLDASLRTLDAGDGFTIPRSDEVRFDAMVYRLSFVVVDHLTRWDDWTWQIGRDLMLQHNGQARFAAPDLTRLSSSPELGPVGCVIAARVTRLTAPNLAKLFAARGLTRLSLDDFRNDYQFLLRSDTLLGQLTRAAADELRSMPDEQLAPLVAEFVKGAKLRADVIGGLRKWRKTDQQPLGEALPPLLDDLWFNGLRDLVSGGLKGLAEVR